MFGFRKLYATTQCYLLDDEHCCFDTRHACDGQTDRHRFAYASSGKITLTGMQKTSRNRQIRQTFSI